MVLPLGKLTIAARAISGNYSCGADWCLGRALERNLSLTSVILCGKLVQ